MAGGVVDLAALRMADLPRVGGKSASLGEMIGGLADAGVRVPGGFSTTADAYLRHIRAAGLDGFIRERLRDLNVEDTERLRDAAGAIRRRIVDAALPADLEAEIRAAYSALGDEAAVAVRSSATAEDLPDASFAGQQETLLNVRGGDAVVAAVRRVFASLYTDRAVAYRAHLNFDGKLALCAAVQKMARADLGASGVMFTLDTESGFADAVFITAAYGLGELVVQGAVNPDEFYVYKPAIDRGRGAIIRRTLGTKAQKMIPGDGDETVKVVGADEADRRRFCIGDEDALELARCALAIEKHYRRAMDIEWAKDGADGKIYILQARPETVQSRPAAADRLRRYRVRGHGALLAEGRAIGQKIGVGPARPVISPAEMAEVRAGDVLIADMTDPDWEPVMKRAAAIVTDRGGRTCHAAIIARELGIPAVVGCGDATAKIAAGETVSVCCAEGDAGRVYAGAMDFTVDEVAVADLPPAPVKMQINLANPDLAFDFARLPCDGVGLARLEFIIARSIGVHPRAALEYASLPQDLQREVRARAAGFSDPREFYVAKLAEGVATIGAAFHPRPVVVRLSDFKTNEYAGMIGGRRFEPAEENPMLGFRGAARYLDASFRPAFALECEAFLRARDGAGLDNLQLMIPFVRTPAEAEGAIGLLADNGLARGRDGLKILMMCELPANAILADEFLRHFDGFSIGSNDLTQTTLGLDRDSGVVAGAFDERDPAVRRLIALAIAACRRAGKYVGICGQGPSDYPDFAAWLVEEGVSAISLNPDTLIETRLALARGK